jgi:hypothetical protein
MGRCPSPTLQWSMAHFSHCYKLSCSKVAVLVLPLLPYPASLFIYSSSGECPSPTLHSSGHPVLFAMCLFLLMLFSCLFIIQFVFFSFFPGWVLVCPGGYADLAQDCLWEYCMLLSSPGGLLLHSRLETGVWQGRSPPGFSVYCGVGMLCVGWGCGGVGVLPLLGGFFCKAYLQHLSKILL